MSRAYLALAAICIIWSTTYAGIKVAIRDFPPFFLVGIRQMLGGLVLVVWAYLIGKAKVPDRKYYWKQAITGFCTITGGNGFITWALQFVPTGLSAVIGSLTPVVVVLINLVWTGGERISWRVMVGVVLGFLGLGLIFSDGWKYLFDPDYRLGVAACFASCLTWSLGTVMAKRWNSPTVSPLYNAGLQITFGGLGGFMLSPFFDHLQPIKFTWEGGMALLYLSLIGSALAFTLYMYALKHLTATVSSLYTYVNPVGAVLIGWMVWNEPLNWLVALGLVITVSGLYLVNRFSSINSRPRSHKPPSKSL